MDNDTMGKVVKVLKPLASLLYAVFVIITLAIDAAEKRLNDNDSP